MIGQDRPNQDLTPLGCLRWARDLLADPATRWVGDAAAACSTRPRGRRGVRAVWPACSLETCDQVGLLGALALSTEPLHRPGSESNEASRLYQRTSFYLQWLLGRAAWTEPVGEREVALILLDRAIALAEEVEPDVMWQQLLERSRREREHCLAGWRQWWAEAESTEEGREGLCELIAALFQHKQPRHRSDRRRRKGTSI